MSTAGRSTSPSGSTSPERPQLGGGGVKEGAGIAPNIPVPDPKRQLDVALNTLAAEAR